MNMKDRAVDDALDTLTREAVDLGLISVRHDPDSPDNPDTDLLAFTEQGRRMLLVLLGITAGTVQNTGLTICADLLSSSLWPVVLGEGA